MPNFDLFVDTLTLIIKSATLGLLSFLVLPLQLKEFGSIDKLKGLKFQLIIIGFIMFITNLLAVVITLLHVLALIPLIIFNSLLQITNAVAFLAISIIFYKIYTTKYPQEG